MKLDDYKVLRVNAGQRSEIIDYGIKMVGAPLEWPETTGAGIKVGIVDTGIDENHEDLQGAVKEAINFSTDDRTKYYDDNGHGTHVAGIIAARKNNIGVVGVAPQCDLYIAKAFDKNGNGEFAAIQKSLLWMVEKNVDVINMSFSSKVGGDAYQKVVSQLNRQGITLVCAAGNDGPSENSIGYPASFSETIAVTAVDQNKNVTDFSSRGSKAEISAAGKDIYSTYPGNQYATLSGTSMATPIITGAVALLQAKARLRLDRRLTPAEVKLLLDIYSEDMGTPGRDKSYGYGVFTFGRFDRSDSVSTSFKIQSVSPSTSDSPLSAIPLLIAAAYLWKNK